MSKTQFWIEPANRDINNSLYELVSRGDAAAREEMILRNTPLVQSIVERFIIFVPSIASHREDLISVGTLGLIEAVNKMASDGPRQDANPNGLITLCIQRNIGGYIDKEDCAGITQQSKEPTRDEDGNVTKRRARRVHDNGCEDLGDLFAEDTRKLRDLRDTLEACAESEDEQQILTLREQGYVDREIAEILGLSQTTTYVLRRTMYARFLELTGWKGEV